MFTGIIEELGTLVDLKGEGTSLRLQIKAERVFEGSGLEGKKSLNGLKIDDSIAINGVCQTVVAVRPPYFEVIAVQETLQKTTLGSLTPGKRSGDAVNNASPAPERQSHEWQLHRSVNLERAATLETRLGGHIVQGHVDGTATVSDIRDLKGSWEFYFELPSRFERYVVPQGSVSIDGVSLTVAAISGSLLKTAIIPHTYGATNFQFLKVGDKVNIELDVMAKLVERLMKPYLGTQP